jgi:hypothetical protein
MVRQLITVPVGPFRKDPNSRYEVDGFFDAAIQVHYIGDHPIVEFIELSSDPRLRVLYGEIEVFATPADEVLMQICVEADFDRNDPEVPYSYIFPALQLALWRPVVPEDEHDEDGRYFSTIGIGQRGYFDQH